MKRSKEDLPDLTALSKVARAAGAAHERQGAAFSSELAAEAALLEKVIEIARPALPSICSKHEGMGGLTWYGAQIAAMPHVSLFVLQTGVFGEFASSYETPEVLSALDVVEKWDPREIIEGLTHLLEKQVKGRGASAEVAEARAAKLQAISKLLGKG